MRTDDYYQLLGVGRSATQEAIKRAFRTGVLAVHPDFHPDDSLSSERTREIVEAYRVLSNPETRRRYDLSLPLKEALPVTYYRTRPTDTGRWAMKWLTMAATLLLIVCTVAMLVRAMFADSRMVFRPSLVAFTGMQTPGQDLDERTMPAIVEPSLTDGVEWYHSQQYQLSLADGWAASQLRMAYQNAARRARHHGDMAAARFYRSLPTPPGNLVEWDSM